MLRSTEGGFILNEQVYPGILLLWPKEDHLLFFNDVDLEDYVCCVLGSEAYAGWPLEALKANAVAIRSYALYSRGKHGVYDLCAGEHCQVYRGLPQAEVFRTAVTVTTGQVLTWQAPVMPFIIPVVAGGPVIMRKSERARPCPIYGRSMITTMTVKNISGHRPTGIVWRNLAGSWEFRTQSV